jgi:ABC-type metal ion transport system substrate-binding protein
MNNYLVAAIRKLKPNSEFSFQENDYSTINWIVLNGDAPTQAEIDAAIEQVKVEEAQAAVDKAAQRVALLERLGITEEEARILLGGN